MTSFLKDETGAMTVDFTVVVAGIVGLAIAAAAAVTLKTEGLAMKANSSLNGSPLPQTAFSDPPHKKHWWGTTVYEPVQGWSPTTGTALEYHQFTGVDGQPTWGIELEGQANQGGIQSDLGRLISGSEYVVQFDAGISSDANRSISNIGVFVDGKQVGTVTQGTTAQTHQIAFTADPGLNTSTLELRSLDTWDGRSATVTNISVNPK